MSGPPRTLVCFLCGRQFGTSSLKIHQPQCYKKKHEQWIAGDRVGPEPQDPSKTQAGEAAVGVASGGMSIEEFNDQQYKNFTNNMAQCENCGRRFAQDRLAVHQRSCKPGNAAKPVNGKEFTPAAQINKTETSTRPPALGNSTRSPGIPSGLGSPSGTSSKVKGPSGPPRTLVCFLCGQQFGSSSLKIHQPQCYKKKHAQWLKGGQVGPEPQDPSKTQAGEAAVGVASGGMSIEEFNEQQYKTFTANMAQCEHCGRRFNPDRLAVHQRSCKPGSTAKPISRTLQ